MLFVVLRYYPPEKQGLRPYEYHCLNPYVFELRYYPPEKQGLRHAYLLSIIISFILRYYPPEKQGLRLKFFLRLTINTDSDTILQKNKD